MARSLSHASLSEVLTAKVDDLNHEGWGVIRAGKVVFVAGALPGEVVEYRIRRRERGHDEAELVRVVEPSPDRIEPGCAHFGLCGGSSRTTCRLTVIQTPTLRTLSISLHK